MVVLFVQVRVMVVVKSDVCCISDDSNNGGNHVCDDGEGNDDGSECLL